MKIARRLLGSCVLLLAAGHALADGVDRLHDFLDTTRTLRANFVQTIVFKSGKKPQTSSGSVVLARPGKFRWQVDKPFQQLLVGDGSKVWLFDPDLKQVSVKKMSDSLGGTPAAILAGEPGQGSAAAVGKTFRIVDGGDSDGLNWAEARPKAGDSTFEKVRLGFRGEQLARMEMHDNFGQVTLVEFAAVERNPTLPPALFRFNPPPGVDVVGD